MDEIFLDIVNLSQGALHKLTALTSLDFLLGNY